MSTDPDADLPELPAGHDSVLGERERVAAALFGRDAQLSTIGRYRVEDVLGRGAMGVVYEAWDEQLQRTVAVKLIARDLEVGGAELRFRREALALGKLAHPNVVTVHEVGTHGGRLFIAMELVRGETLDAWFGAAERSWQDCLGVFVQAGRGLDAAHRAGLVHRDFKPANCIVGESGRVRVLDFGLARGSADLLDEDVAATAPAVSSLDVSVTRTGATVGTPAYMAPEQLRGGEVSAASDQFAFCVALYEALEGVRPFPGRSVPEIYENIEAGEMVAGSGRAPTEVVRIVERGLASSPTERWPNLGELVDELEALPHRRARRRTVWSLAGVGVLAAAVAGAAWIPRDPCEDLPTTDVWSESRRATLKEALGDGPVWISLDDAATQWVSDWHGAQKDVCTAARVTHQSNEETLARQSVCLTRRDRIMQSLLGALEFEERPALRAPAILRALPPLQDCERADAAVRVPPPPEPIASDVAQVRDLVDSSFAAHVLGRPGEAERLLESAWARAADLEYPPIKAEVLLRQGWVTRHAALDGGRSLLERAFALAEGAGDDSTAADAATALVSVSTALGRPSAGRRWRDVAAAKLNRIEAGDFRRGLLARNSAQLALLERDGDAADATSKEALHHLGRAAGTQSLVHAEALSLRARVLEVVGTPGQARRAHDLSLAALRNRLGNSHPQVGVALFNRGVFRFEVGDDGGAGDDFDAALPILEAAGEPRTLSALLVARARLASMSGTLELQQLERIAALWEPFAANDPERLDVESLVATFHLELGDAIQAMRIFRQVHGVRQRADEPDVVVLALDSSNIGECLLALERWGEAEARFRRVLDDLEHELPADDPVLAYPLTGLGRSLVARGDSTAARPLLERSWTLLEAAPSDANLRAQTAAALAATLGASPRAAKLDAEAEKLSAALGRGHEHDDDDREDE